MVETDNDDFPLHDVLIVGHAARTVESYPWGLQRERASLLIAGGTPPANTRHLLEPAPMPARENGFPPEKVTEHDAETEQGQERCLLAAQSRGNATV